MGLFNKKGDKKERKKADSLKKSREDYNSEELPKLPELPELPKRPQESQNSKFRSNFKKEYSEDLPQLPSLPAGSFGDRFSQNTIKEAVNGKKEINEDFLNNDSFESEMVQKPSQTPRTISQDKVPKDFKGAAQKVKEAEPVFIRIDKFQDSLELIQKSKKKISDIEKEIKDIKELKQKEEKEIEKWESEMQEAKSHLEKVDNQIFSKIE